MDVIGYGDADIDIYLTLDRIPDRDEKILAKSYSFHSGGMVANTIVSLSRLGRNVGYHGRIGDDPFGVMALENLKVNNVDTRGVILKPGGHTFFCVIMVDSSGEKALISAPTDCRIRQPEDIDEKVIAESKHLHTTAIFIDAANHAVDLAKKHGLTVSLDLDSCTAGSREELLSLISKADIIFLNKRGAKKLGEQQSSADFARFVAKQMNGIVCITLGEEGSLTATPSQLYKSPAFNIDVVDTTGAGDTFAAGFIHGYLAEWPLDYVLVYANAVAALNSLHMGGHTGSPTHEDVVTFLNERGIKTIKKQ